MVRCGLVWCGLVSLARNFYPVRRGKARRGEVWLGLVRQGRVWFGGVWRGLAWRGQVGFGWVRSGLVWYGFKGGK